jgi:hypothetical protein
MTEGLFVLTTLFVAYVIYVIVNEKKANGDKDTKPVVAAKQQVQQATVPEKPKVAASKAESAVTKPKPVAAAKKASAAPIAVKSTAEKPTAAKKAPAVPADVKSTATKPTTVKKGAEIPATESISIKGTGLKDPTTGEVATTYSNYRFTKRWIKEALVSEKLVEKVYKNDELNASVEAKIKAGIIKLEGMKKYKP